jgi:hypothetical protein
VRIKEVGGKWRNIILDNYILFYAKGNVNHQFGTGLFVQNISISAVKREEFISDRMSYINLKGSLM